MNKIFCVTSTDSVGCTFLDWSIHYLSGSTKFYNVESGWSDLVTTPLDSSNAHAHPKNHPNGVELTNKVIDKLTNVSATVPLSFYPVPIHEELAAKQINLVINQPTDFYDDKITQYQQHDYADIWQQLAVNNISIVYIKLTSNCLYTQSVRQLDRNAPNLSNQLQTTKEVQANYLNTFFKDSQLYWNKLGLTNNWDHREFIALNIRPYYYNDIDKYIDFSASHYYVDAQELWYNGKNTLINIMQYLGLTVDAGRLTSWLPVYYEWQQKQLGILKFSWNIDHICNCIVNNYYYDISSYNLDLWHEAIIQHNLIYKHNVTFKAWGLETLPTNTQELHLLLEPNIHPVEDVYGMLKGLS
jgi:hypothetical protein